MPTATPSLTQPCVLQKTERVWRYLLRNNILYLLSALLMLIGCYLICMPYLLQRRLGSGPLLPLTIQCYEALVICTCAFIMRRAPVSREGSSLLLVEMLFLFDATFTLNAFLPANFLWGFVVATGLNAIKIFGIEAGAGVPVFGRLKTFLLPALGFMYSFQSLLAWHSAELPRAREVMTYSVWFALGSLPLLLLPARGTQEEAPPAGKEGGRPPPPWLTQSFKAQIALLTLGLLLLQAVGQCWVHISPFALPFLFPLLFSVMAVLPLFRPKASALPLNTLRLFVTTYLVLWGLFECDSTTWRDLLGSDVSPLRVDFVFGGLVFLLIWWRERGALQLDFAGVLLALGILGHDWASTAASLAHPSLIQVAACTLLAGAWIYFSRNFAVALAIGAGWLWVALGVAHPAGAGVALDFVRYYPICAFLLTVVFKQKARPWRVALLVLIFVLGVTAYQSHELDPLLYFYAAAGTLAVGLWWDWRTYLCVLTSYVAAANLLCLGGTFENTTMSWGWVVIAFAFVSFGLAFLVTHQNLKNLAAPPQVIEQPAEFSLEDRP